MRLASNRRDAIGKDKRMKLVVATSYFPVSADIQSNLRYTLKHMRSAQKKGADVIHFPEACLSGYAEVDFKSYENFNWQLLKESTRVVMERARSLGIWVILGSTHELSKNNKPHNSLYIISDKGEIVDRYDKLFCGGPASENSGDLAHYSSGNHFCVFAIKGIQCGALICHDCRYPELYRQYKQKGAQLIFQSFHAGNVPQKKWKKIGEDVGEKHHRLNHASTYPGIIFPATIQSMAANNYLWIGCSNSSAPQSCFPAFFVRADGIITGRLRRNIPGVLISTIDTRESLYDSTVAWRDRAINGVYHSGTLVKDSRSRDRTGI
jgi:predicted amidohydrolase